MSAERDELLSQAEDLLKAAKAAGADVAETSMSVGMSISLQRRLGKIEETERAEGRGLGLRVFVGRQNASISAGSIDRAAFARLAEQAVAIAANDSAVAAPVVVLLASVLACNPSRKVVLPAFVRAAMVSAASRAKCAC